VSQLAWRLLATYLARTIELRPGLDHQFADDDIAVDSPAGGDFQAFGFDAALELPADQDSTGTDLALYASLLPDGNLGVGTHRALQAAIDVQIVAQGKVADQL